MGELVVAPPTNSMTKGFLIAICILIMIALIIFPLIVSYKAQKNKKNKY